MNTFPYTETNKPGTPGDKPSIDQIIVRWTEDELNARPAAPDATEAASDSEEAQALYERIAAFEAGEWSYVGCQATARVSYPIDAKGNRRLQEFTSGGLWGIESDSSDDFRRETELEELDDLKSHLEAFGVDTSDFWAKSPVSKP